MTKRSKKRVKQDNYSTPTSTPSYSQRRSKEMDMFAANGGFGPEGFRTPFPVPNTPVSIAANTPTLGNQPIPSPVVPLRGFLEIVENDEDRKICDGTTIFQCRTGSISKTAKDCRTCRMDIDGKFALHYLTAPPLVH